MNLEKILPLLFSYLEEHQPRADHFELMLLRSERRRVTILAGIFLGVMAWLMIANLFFVETIIATYNAPLPLQPVLLLFGCAVIYELIARYMINWHITHQRMVPDRIRFTNVFVETSIPSFALYILADIYHPQFAFISAPSFSYYLFIILSTLRLDYRFSIFTSIVAAVEYSALATYFLNTEVDPLIPSLLREPLYYYGKATIMIAAGIVAGLVGNEIRRRSYTLFTTIEERNQIVNMFGQQVSQSIVDELVKQKEEFHSRLQRVCVMFLDIRGFTTFAEKHTPEEIVQYQNAFFTSVVDVVDKNNGIINQFLGDGAMITFGAPVSKGNDCQNALNTALEILERVKMDGEHGKIQPTKVGIGIHVGEAVTGNVGSSKRKQYSITGNVVICASRIEQLNKEYNSQLLISKDVFEGLDEKPVYAEPLGPAMIKGREEAIEIYKLI